MILGYNTNGFAHHSLQQAIEVIASIGFRSIAITIDHGALNPFDPGHVEQLREVRGLLERHNLTPVIETGGRFLLDPWQKHEPTLLAPEPSGRAERVAFYRYAIDVACQLGASCVSLWSGVATSAEGADILFGRLAKGLREVLGYAGERGVVIGFEPEPGMLVDRLDTFDRLHSLLGAPENLCMTLDVGHLHCLGETPIAEQIVQHAGKIVNVHIEDMRAGVHDHLMFGEGEIDFAPVIAALKQIAYNGPITVELSRHSHMAPVAARRSFEYLHPLCQNL